MKAGALLPKGFRFAGIRAGVKLNKPDTALIVSDRECAAAARVTTNRARAHACNRTAGLLPASDVRAIVAVSGNANALSGAAGRAADETLAVGTAEALGVGARQVVTATTGVIGSVLPADAVVSAMPSALGHLEEDPWAAARAIMTTDRVPKFQAAEVVLETPDGEPLRGVVACVGKGSGMIHPNMGTMLAFVVTDLPLTAQALDRALGAAVQRTFHRLSVDGDQSTNDMAVALANGAAGGEAIGEDDARLEHVEAVMAQVLEAITRAIAADGEGATRLLTVEVSGAQDEGEAQSVARAVCRSNLVKSAIFGADPSWGRVLAAAGQELAALGADTTPKTWRLRLQGTEVFRGGEPVAFDRKALGTKLSDTEVVVQLDLGRAEGRATAWGCDLSYEYVKINADYAGAVTENEDGAVSLDAHLAGFSPKVKRSLLIEALRYIERFRGQRVVIKITGTLIEDPETCDRIAEDIVLLRSVGMQPIVVHGGSEAVSRAMAQGGRESRFVDGHRVTLPEDVSVVEMILLGKVNRQLVARVNALGGRAVGLSGADGGGFLKARPFDSGLEAGLGQLGQVSEVDAGLVSTLLGEGYIPIIAPLGVGESGETWNLDAEDASAAVAVAFEAFKLIYLVGASGVMQDGERISRLPPRQAQRLMRDGTISGPLVHIIEAALNAVQRGVPKVHIVDGRVAHNLVSELFTDAGVGTLIERGFGGA